MNIHSFKINIARLGIKVNMNLINLLITIIVVIVLIIIIFWLLNHIGTHFFIAPEAGLMHTNYADYGSTLSTYVRAVNNLL